MADGLLDMIIQSANFDNLTAVAADGLSGKSFVGQNGVTHNGNIVDRGSPTHSLPVNGSITLSAGKYSGGTVKQNLITMNGYTVRPGSKNITVPTKDRYMTGNIVISSLPNLKPENIKEGEYVGGVGPGTWKGYVVTDPYTLYHRGAFGPGQNAQIINGLENDYPFLLTLEERDLFIHFDIIGNHVAAYSFLMFNPIDITQKNTLKIEYSIYRKQWSQRCYAQPVLMHENPKDYMNTNLQNNVLQKNLFKITDWEEDATYRIGFIYQQYEYDDGKTKHIKTYDISSFSRSAYFMLYLFINYDTWFRIHSIKFE